MSVFDLSAPHACFLGLGLECCRNGGYFMAVSIRVLGDLGFWGQETIIFFLREFGLSGLVFYQSFLKKD